MSSWLKRSGALIILVVGLTGHSAGWADMLISPTRAYLDAENRTANLILRNTSNGPKTYRLSWEDKRINELGDYEPVAESDDWPSAAAMIRFSPRQITVGPGENQTVRLSLRPPSDLAPGEYRSHLKLQVVAEESEPAAVMEMDAPGQEGIGFRLFMQMSFSVPVIVRHQVPRPDVAISNVEVMPAEGQQKSMALNVTLERSGDASSFGELLVEMQRDSSSPVERIGRRKEVYVFHETQQKSIRVPLRDSAIPAGSWIRVAYQGVAEYEGIIWDEKVFRSE